MVAQGVGGLTMYGYRQDPGREVGRVALLNIVDDVTMLACSFGPPQVACAYKEGNRRLPSLDHL